MTSTPVHKISNYFCQMERLEKLAPCLAIFSFQQSITANSAFRAGKEAAGIYHGTFSRKTLRQLTKEEIIDLSRYVNWVGAAVSTESCFCNPFVEYCNKLLCSVSELAASVNDLSMNESVESKSAAVCRLHECMNMLSVFFHPGNPTNLYANLGNVFRAALPQFRDMHVPPIGMPETTVTCCLCLEQDAEDPERPGSFLQDSETYFIAKFDDSEQIPTCSNCVFLSQHSCICTAVDRSNVLSGAGGTVYHTSCFAQLCKSSTASRLYPGTSVARGVTLNGNCGAELLAAPCPVCSKWVNFKRMGVFSLAEARGKT